jgi:hypothetical protein
VKVLIKTTFNKKNCYPFYMICGIFNLQTILLIKKTKPTEQHLKFKSLHFCSCAFHFLFSFESFYYTKSTSLLKAHANKLIKLTFNGEKKNFYAL